ncbi:ABC transporter permease [Nibrella saemangeumensis]|uniref:ABC transporter permease n=1 Tax=Nibrella saemangeumensis TaxID=1084526 RepID=A0ABP8M9D0_9BACT
MYPEDFNQSKIPAPPRWLDTLLGWFVAPHLREEVLGDIHERYYRRAQRLGQQKARRTYWREVLAYLRPSMIKRKPNQYRKPLFSDMLRNYLKIAFRNLVKNKAYSFINIAGLATGMAVAMLIGLWIWDELSYNKYHQHYNRIAQVMQHMTFNTEKDTWASIPIPVGDELRKSYGQYFERVVLASHTGEHILAAREQKLTTSGKYMEPAVTELLSLNMLKGTRAGLTDPNSIILSESLAKSLFGADNPMGKFVKMDNKLDVKVTGVYEDLPYNTNLKSVAFMAPWALFVSSEGWVKAAQEEPQWNNNSWQIFVQLAPRADFEQVSALIKDVKLNHLKPEEAKDKPELFLQPMRKWHLYSEFQNGVNTGGGIQFVWLFGITGAFILLLACINFMNLSTARSEKRAKEVGIRKAVGSVRSQLISQFFSESLLVVSIAFLLSIGLVLLMLPFFNEVADKKLSMLWTNPVFWLMGLSFVLLTGFLAGSYPALYLSAFQPVKVLKGTFRMGRLAALPRKVLVVVQFTVSVALIIGTIVVYRQIEHAKDRPVGYVRQGLITVPIITPELRDHYEVLRNDLLQSGAVAQVGASVGEPTQVYSANGDFEWEGKDPGFKDMFGTIGVTHDFGKTVGWQFVQGRDFSREYATDSTGIVLNETAVKYMGLKDPVGKTVRWPRANKSWQIVGVIKDMVMASPFEPVYPTFFLLGYDSPNTITVRLAPQLSTSESLDRISPIFKKYNPAVPFEYKFVDDEYASKFGQEERISKLASFFAILAIFISCLGLFGLASFVAEQRTKEIGVRKVLGASVANLWQLLSKDFVVLVLISLVIASPIAYYLLSNWLENYSYRTDIPWWVFAVAGSGAVLITLLTVSFQALKAALIDPVKSLRTE